MGSWGNPPYLLESPNFSGLVAEALIPASKDPLFEGHENCVGWVGGDGGPKGTFSVHTSTLGRWMYM